MSLKNEALLTAVKKGYSISDNGDLLNKKGQILIGSCHRGYKYFSVRHEGKDVTVSFHRLAAYQKFGNKIFSEGIEVRHLNGDSLDNSSNNIRIGTHSENMMDVELKDRVIKSLKAASKRRKYDRDEVKRFHRHESGSIAETMHKFGMTSYATLHYILNT